MKTKLTSAIFLIVLYFALSTEPSALGQVPQGFNYQAVAKDASSGNPITEPIDVKIAILSDDDPETIIREEIFYGVDPNDQGLFSLVVGTGTLVSGLTNFSDIDWTVTPKYIRTKIYYGGEWKNMGPAQLWSVPYAMYSPSNNPWLLNGSSLYYTMGYVGIETDIPMAPLTVRQNDNTGITYPLYLQNQSNDWTATEKGIGIKFGRINPTSGHDYGTIRGTIADGSNGGHGRLQLIGGGGTDPHVTINWNGNVGIGTTSPEYQLQTTANVRLNSSVVGDGIEMSFFGTGNRYSGIDFHGDDTYTDYALRIIRNNTGPDAESRIEHRGNGELSLQTDEAAPIIFRTAYAERMKIAASGNVGIGTSTPGYKLDVNGTARITGNLSLDNVLNAGGYSGGAAGKINTYNIEIGGPSPSATNGIATIFFHHHGAVAHQLRYTSGNLSLEAAGNGYGTTNTPSLSIGGGLYAAINGGNVGIGTATPSSKLAVRPPADWADETPLFEVRNKYNIPVFAVYNNGVRILVDHNDFAKGAKGGFSVGGYDYGKGETVALMRVTPDSVRFNINNTSSGKGAKGGFSVGGFGDAKDIDQDFLFITPQYSNSGTNNLKMGFEAGKNSSGPHNTYLGVKAGKGVSGSTTASNIFIGEGSGMNNSGSYQVFSLQLPDGTWTSFYTSYGGENVAVGNYTGVGLAGNFISHTGGQKNVLLGHYTGYKLTSGSENVIIGDKAGYNLVSGDGNIFIGPNAGRDETGSDKLYIANSSTTNPLIYGDFDLGYAKINGELFVSSDLAVGTTSATQTLDVNGNGRFRSVGSGTNYSPLNLTSTGVLTTAASDISLKKDIVQIQDALKTVMDMRGVTFTWKDDNSGGRNVGFIAQDMEKVLPEVVFTNPVDGLKGINYPNITAVLAEAIKEQQKQIESQQMQIEELKKMVSDLQRKAGSSFE